MSILRWLSGLFTQRTAGGAKRLALLVDGDNADAKHFANVVVKLGEFGRIVIKRVYGDWRETRMHPWCEVSRIYDLQRSQQNNIKGKNSTDIAMVVEAMDILNRHEADGICIVSSDGDYARLATRVRSDGLMVIGVGRKNTPLALKNQCDEFIHYEDLAKPSPVGGVVRSGRSFPIKRSYSRRAAGDRSDFRRPLRSGSAVRSRLAPRQASTRTTTSGRPVRRRPVAPPVRSNSTGVATHARRHLVAVSDQPPKLPGTIGVPAANSGAGATPSTRPLKAASPPTFGPPRIVPSNRRRVGTIGESASKAVTTAGSGNRPSAPVAKTIMTTTPPVAKSRRTAVKPTPTPATGGSASVVKPAGTGGVSPAVEKLIRQAFERASKGGPRANLAGVGTALRKLDPEGERGSYYGYPKLYLLIEQFPDTYEVNTDRTKKVPVKYMTLKS